MKKIIIAIMFAAFTFGAAHAQLKNVALISVFGDRNLSDDPLETKLYEAIMKDSSFNLTPIVKNFDVNLRANLLPQFPFPFLEKDKVVNAPGYQELASLTRYAKFDAYSNMYVTAAENYVPIAAFGIADDKDAIKKAFELYPDLDGVMIAYINFNLYDAAGIGGLTSKKVYAYVNLKIFNKDGKVIFKLKERASSKKGVAAIGGFVPNAAKIMPLIEDASAKLALDMEKKLPKSLKKMNKKLSKLK